MANVKVILASKASEIKAILASKASEAKAILASKASEAKAIAERQTSTNAAVVVSPSIARPDGPLYSLQYNNSSFFAGSNTLLFNSDQSSLQISGSTLLVGTGSVRIETNASNENLFLVKHNSANLIKVDSLNKRISLSTNTSAGEYYVGIGTSVPTEKLHVVGNLKLQGDIILDGNIIPLVSGVSDLGSASKPFRDIYLKGNTINFVEAGVSIGSDSQGQLLVQGKNEQGESVTFLSVGNSGITGVFYKNILESIQFHSVLVPSGVDSVTIPITSVAGYSPKILCDLVVTESSYDVFTSIRDISSTGFKVDFSDIIRTTGNFLNYYVSAKDF